MMYQKSITSVQDQNFSEIWKLYLESFPNYEIRLLPAHQQAMYNKQFRCQGFFENNDRLIAILFDWQYKNYNYIEFFAIHPCYRGKNYGTDILKQYQNSGKNIILEIDPPIDEVSKKRLHFYERLGFQFNDYFYIHPSFHLNPQPHELKILSYPNVLSKVEFNDFLKFMNQTVLCYREK